MMQCTTARARASSLVVAAAVLAACALPVAALVAEGERAPEIVGQSWINSGPLSMAALAGRVVLVEFWTYG
jgi:hypothetical protein